MLLLVGSLTLACQGEREAPADPPGADAPAADAPKAAAPKAAAEDAPPAAKAPQKPDRNAFEVEAVKVVYDLQGQTTGTRTFYVEGYGARVGLLEESTTYGEAKKSAYLWDGAKGHLRRNPGDKVSSMGLRLKDSEPTSFATTPAADLERVGYARIGTKGIAGKTCEHWKNEKLNYEGCRWKGLELEFLNGAGTAKIIQRMTATAVVEGEAMPAELTALAP